MEKQIIFMFSGQGSQYHHMGKELYENHQRFKFWMDHCDEMVRPLIEASLLDVLYRSRGKSEPFDHILYTNPALLCIEYSLSNVLMEMGIQPDYVLGYSLGEITSAVVSGVITLAEGLQIVVGVARLVEQKTQPAEMLAIVESRDIMAEFPDFFQDCWLTGKNFQRGFVVSGLPDHMRHLQEELKKKSYIHQKLPVNYGFHTELIDPIEHEFKQLVRRMNLSSIGIPIISSFKCDKVHEASEDYFWNVIRHPVDFESTINRILKKGDIIFIDAGPSGTLATFVKYLLPADSGSLSLQSINQFGRDLRSIENLKSSLSVAQA